MQDRPTGAQSDRSSIGSAKSVAIDAQESRGAKVAPPSAQFFGKSRKPGKDDWRKQLRHRAKGLFLLTKRVLRGHPRGHRFSLIASLRSIADTKSLAFRQFVASLILLPLMLLASGYGLVQTYKTDLLTAEQDSLKAQTYILLGGAEPDERGLSLPEYFIEPRLNTVNSGLYAFVSNARHRVVWRSRSLSLSNIELDTKTPSEIEPGREQFDNFFIKSGPPAGFFRLRFDTIWNINGEDRLYRFNVVKDRTDYRLRLNTYKREMVALLIVLAIFILVLQFTIMHFGFHPLRKLASRLEQFQSGQTNKLEGSYAAELSPVVNNLNMLLANEKKQRARYKNTLSDLAHSLKTPLSVISVASDRASAGDKKAIDAQMEEIRQQVARMSDIVDHQLRRATMQSSVVQHTEINLTEQTRRLIEVMSKVYREKGVAVNFTAAPYVMIAMEQNDLLEMLGNIIENGFKYCRSRINIECRQDRNDVIIAVGDDGEGIPEAQRDKVLQRGARADTARPGQGIGLSVSVDIISSYNGSLSVDRSQLGGALFIIALPR